MIRLANERHNIIGNATARLWLLRNETSLEGRAFRRFLELSLVRSEHPALALSWTLYHVLGETSPLYGTTADDLEAAKAALVVVVSGYDIVAAQTVHARQTYEHPKSGLGSATRTSSTPPTMDVCESITAGFMTLSRNRHPDQ